MSVWRCELSGGEDGLKDAAVRCEALLRAQLGGGDEGEDDEDSASGDSEPEGVRMRRNVTTEI